MAELDKRTKDALMNRLGDVLTGRPESDARWWLEGRSDTGVSDTLWHWAPPGKYVTSGDVRMGRPAPNTYGTGTSAPPLVYPVTTQSDIQRIENKIDRLMVVVSDYIVKVSELMECVQHDEA